MTAALICWSCWSAVLRAQDSGTPPVLESPARESDPSADGAELIWIQDENGGWRAVPYSEEALRTGLLEQFPPAGEELSIAPVYISELSLDGAVVADRARLTASFSIEVTAEGAFDVPLRLNQAHLLSIRHEGPGRASPILDAQGDDGLHWRFEGRGTHRLWLTFLAPLRRSPEGHQLLLTLPALPDYLVTRITLKLPGDQLVLRRPPGIVDLQQIEAEDGSRQVVAEVEGQRLELIWTERRESADALSSVRTIVNVRRENEQLLLVGEQEITVEQGDVSEILFRLPPEFAVQDMALAGLREQTSVMWAPKEEGWLRVLLPEPLHQRFTLVWTLQRAFPEEGGLVRINGLDVAKAASVQGEIRMEMIDGYAVSWNESNSKGVRRVSLRDEPARGTAWGAFKFENAEFELEVDVRPVAPKTDADVAYYLRVEPDELLLTVDVAVQVLTGRVQELQFDWPNLIEERWSVLNGPGIQATSGGETLPAAFTLTSSDEGNQAVLTLSRPVSGSLFARLRLRREFPAEQSATDVTLPRVRATWPARPTLFIAEAVDVRAEFTDDSDARSTIDPAAAAFDALPEGFVDARVRGWELTDADTSVPLNRTRHPRSVTAATSVTIGTPDNSVLHVMEEFAYQVEYGRIETMLFDVPARILEVYHPGIEELGIRGAGLRFSDADGSTLMARFDGQHYAVTLPRARHGAFVVRLEYALPLSQSMFDAGAAYLLPIVQPLDADVTQTAVHADPTSTLDVAVLDAAWESIPHISGGDVFYVADGREEAALELRFAAREFVQRLRIDACYLQTAIHLDGSAETLGAYLLKDPPAELLVSLPAGHSEFEFRWNGEVLLPARDSANAPYVLTLPESTEAGQLVVFYQTDAATDVRAVAEASLECPSFGPDVHIDETIWEVVLPHQHLLSGTPPRMRPEFEWQRKTVLWVRAPTGYVQSRRREILGPAAEELPSLSHTGNHYAFSTSGSVTRIQVESMSQSIVVLLGAGLTMLLGFVFGRFPAVRNVYSLLVLGFLFSLAAVWRLDLMQLLVQPALIGLGLAILAVKFDTATRTGSIRRKKEGTSRESAAASGERLSSVPSAVSSGVARTALYRAANSSESGSGPHE